MVGLYIENIFCFHILNFMFILHDDEMLVNFFFYENNKNNFFIVFINIYGFH